MAGQRCDIVVVGAGIVGLSTAMELTRRFPRLRTIVVEKETQVAQHQSGHNSGVIHSGIYYKPGSLKARLCVEGARLILEFCQAHSIPYSVCGKLIVATTQDEIPRLQELQCRGAANGIPGIRFLPGEQMKEVEPHCGGRAALLVPTTGITDYASISRAYAAVIHQQGGEIRLGSEVIALCRSNTETVVETRTGSLATRFLINCAGLHSDRVSRMAGNAPDVQIVPFRGEYYDLVPARQGLVRGLIYPVPDPRFPFLGVHFTRRIHGGVDAGPNAVLSFKREGYTKMDFNTKDAWDELTFPGIWKMAGKYWRSAAGEFHRSFSKRAFVRSLQKLIPEIREADLVPGGSGVRAQAMRRDGSLVDDFQFLCSDKMLHVGNVPSPAATASIPIGRAIVQMASEAFQLEQA